MSEIPLSLSYCMNVSFPRLRYLFGRRKEIQGTTRTLVAVNALGVILSLCAMGGFYSNLVQAQNISGIDAAQNTAIAINTQKIDDIQKDRDKRITEAEKHRTAVDEAVQADHDRITHDEAWAIGFFAALGAVQSFGLFKTLKHTKQ